MNFYIYGFLAFISFFLVIVVSYIEWRKKGYSKSKFWMLATWIGFFSLFGARWWYLAFNPSDFQGILSLFSISSGRSILGAIFFGTLSIYVFQKLWMSEVEWRIAISILLPNALLGQAISRWGNFVNQEIYGQVVTDLSNMPLFIQEMMFIDGAYRQPLFLYEFVLNLLGWVLILSTKFFKWFKPGSHAGLYLMWTGTVRASLELQRDTQFIMYIRDVPTSFVLAIIFAVFGLMMFIYYQFIYEKYTAEYFEFRHSYKINMMYKNLYLTIKLLVFVVNWKDYKKEIKINKQNYNKLISNIDEQEIVWFKNKISKSY